jgi:hypothetical protein
MSLLKAVSMLPLLAALTGCMIEDLKRDVRTLKSDIKALKAFLASTPVPDQCKMPGEQDSSKTCLYKLKITDNSGSAHGVFKAKIHPDVYKANAEDCPRVNANLLPEYASSLAYDCPPLVDDRGKPTDFSKSSHWYPDTEIEYTFQVDGHPVLAVGDDAEFESIAGSKHLKKK